MECRNETCDGIMVSSGQNRDNVLTCRNRSCTNSFPADLSRGEYRAVGVPRGSSFPDGRTKEDVLNQARSRDDLVVLELDTARVLYFALNEGEMCPVESCNGKLKNTGSGRDEKQYSCDTCDFETFEKNVS